MCGINGMIFLNGVERDEKMMGQVRYLFNELMVETQDRGHHATGIASFKRDGGYDFYKAATESELMTTNDEGYLDVVSKFDAKNTSVVIAHTRWYTKGLPANNNNNHPFDIENVVGIHNGSVKNDDYLFGKYKFDRIGEVDSEIIFQLINHYNNNDITYAGLKKALEDTLIRGLFALAFVHKNNTNMLHLVRQEKPMEIALWKDAGIVIFNSDGEYIKKAFRKLQRAGYAFGVSGKQDYEMIQVAEDRYFTVDANAANFDDAISEVKKLYLETSSVKTGTSWTGNTGKKTGGSTSTQISGERVPVTAKDSRGIVLKGEIDKVTGEVIIHEDNGIISMTDDELNDYMGFEEIRGGMTGLNSDDGADFDDETEVCFECFEPLLEDEITGHYNASNPKDERICLACYTEAMETFMADDEREEVI